MHQCDFSIIWWHCPIFDPDLCHGLHLSSLVDMESWEFPAELDEFLEFCVEDRSFLSFCARCVGTFWNGRSTMATLTKSPGRLDRL